MKEPYEKGDSDPLGIESCAASFGIGYWRCGGVLFAAEPETPDVVDAHSPPGSALASSTEYASSVS